MGIFAFKYKYGVFSGIDKALVIFVCVSSAVFLWHSLIHPPSTTVKFSGLTVHLFK